MSDVPETQPPRGLARDLHRARHGAQATAEELRAYVKQFSGKKPQEMLGLVAGSSLVQGTILASIITVVFMAAFTVGPYVWKRMSPPVAKASTKLVPAAAAPAPAATPAAATPGATPATAAAAGTAPAAAPGTASAVPPTAPPGAVPPDPVLDRLGIGETKTADPNKNPLEAGADDLLKDLK